MQKRKKIYLTFTKKLLQLIYLDQTKCKKFDVERRRPAILGWTTEKIKRRQEVEIKSGGFGKGNIEKSFTPQSAKQITFKVKLLYILFVMHMCICICKKQITIIHVYRYMNSICKLYRYMNTI